MAIFRINYFPVFYYAYLFYRVCPPAFYIQPGLSVAAGYHAPHVAPVRPELLRRKGDRYAKDHSDTRDRLQGVLTSSADDEGAGVREQGAKGEYLLRKPPTCHPERSEGS